MSKASGRFLLVLVVVVILLPASAFASHAWGTYHWARQSNPFTLKAHDNVSAAWDAYVNGAGGEPGLESYWNSSSYLRIDVIPNSPLSNVKRCASATGKIEICSAKYGNNGWLGLAGISLSGGHINKGYTKLNDSYFTTPSYNKPAWRRMVVCQELGHDFGLTHTDEVQTNVNHGTCMDYTNDPDGGPGGASETDPSNEYPNAHDNEQLDAIYAHTDSTTTVASFQDGLQAASDALLVPNFVEGDEMNMPWQWGTPIGFDGLGRANTFKLDLGGDESVITHVIWAMPEMIDENPGRSSGPASN